jgi:hypothetical protein
VSHQCLQCARSSKLAHFRDHLEGQNDEACSDEIPVTVSKTIVSTLEEPAQDVCVEKDRFERLGHASERAE